MEDLTPLNHDFIIIRQNEKLIPDGYVQIGFQNLGEVPFTVCKRVLNSGDIFYPEYSGGVFLDNSEYEIVFADVEGEKLAWIHKTYIL